MHFYIFSGSAFASILMKCWDSENFQEKMQNEVKLQYYSSNINEVYKTRQFSFLNDFVKTI